MKKVFYLIIVSLFAMAMGCENGASNNSKAKAKVVDIKVLEQTKTDSVKVSRSVTNMIEFEIANSTAVDPSDPTKTPFAKNKADCLTFAQLNLAAISKQTDGSMLAWHIAQDSGRYIDNSTNISWESRNEFGTFNEADFYNAYFSGGDAWYNYTTPTNAVDVFNADYFLLTIPDRLEVYGTDANNVGVYLGQNLTAAEIGDSGYVKPIAGTKYENYKYIQSFAAEATMVVFTSHVKYNCYFVAYMDYYDDGTGGINGRGQNKIAVGYDGGNTAEDIASVTTDLKLLSKNIYRIYVVAINPTVINANRSIPISITACNTVENGITVNVNMSNIIKSYSTGASEFDPSLRVNRWQLFPIGTQKSCYEPLGMSMTLDPSILNQ